MTDQEMGKLLTQSQTIKSWADLLKKGSTNRMQYFKGAPQDLAASISKWYNDQYVHHIRQKHLHDVVKMYGEIFDTSLWEVLNGRNTKNNK